MRTIFGSRLLSAAIAALLWIIISFATGGGVLFSLGGGIALGVVVFIIGSGFRRLVIDRHRAASGSPRLPVARTSAGRRDGAGEVPGTTVLARAPTPSAVRVTVSPGRSGRGAHCPLRPQSRARPRSSGPREASGTLLPPSRPRSPSQVGRPAISGSSEWTASRSAHRPDMARCAWQAASCTSRRCALTGCRLPESACARSAAAQKLVPKRCTD
jgi:hypothetical protein